MPVALQQNKAASLSFAFLPPDHFSFLYAKSVKHRLITKRKIVRRKLETSEIFTKKFYIFPEICEAKRNLLRNFKLQNVLHFHELFLVIMIQILAQLLIVHS